LSTLAVIFYTLCWAMFVLERRATTEISEYKLAAGVDNLGGCPLFYLGTITLPLTKGKELNP